MEGCLSIDWKVYTSTFLTKKLLVKKLWLVVFFIWNYRYKVLHNNHLSNKVHYLENIDRPIQSLLRVNTIELVPYERRIF